MRNRGLGCGFLVLLERSFCGSGILAHRSPLPIDFLLTARFIVAAPNGLWIISPLRVRDEENVLRCDSTKPGGLVEVVA